MKKKYTYCIIPTVLLLFNLCPILAQDNPLGVSDKAYGFYLRFEKNAAHPKSLAILDSLKQYANEHHDIKAACLASSMLTDHYYYRNDTTNMRKAHNACAKFLTDKPDKRFLFVSWNRLLNHYTYTHNYPKALDELALYHKTALHLKDNYGIAQSYRKLGDIYYAQGLYSIALDEYQKAEEFCISNKMIADINPIYLSQAALHRTLQNYHKILEVTQKVLTSKNPVARYLLAAHIYRFGAYVGMKAWNKARQEKGQVEKMATTIGINGNNYQNYLLSSYQYHLQQGQLEQAKAYLQHYEQEESDYLETLEARTQWYNATREFEKCNALQTKLMHYKDSLNQTNNLQIQTQMTHSFDLDRIELEQNKIILQKIQSQQKQEIIICILLLFLLIISVAYAINRRKSLATERREKEIAKQERLLAEQARKEAEEAKAEAENANRVKSIFLQNMSHEIRTPLNAIVGFNDVLNGNEDIELEEEERKHFLELIHNNTETLTTLIDDILDLSRLQSGSYKINLTDVNASNICQLVLGSVQHRVPSGVELRFLNNGEDFLLHTDKLRVQQILTNFLTNACKHTTKGYIDLSYKLSDENPTNLVFTVTDTGEGIPADKADSIFERFEKLDNFKQGTGLGLNICTLISRLLHGKVWLDTHYTSGCMFKFELPLQQQ